MNALRSRTALGRLFAAATAVAVAGVLALGSATGTRADVPAAQPLQYVALGDSYSAGFGLIPYSEEPAAGCFQADQNYPHLVAEALGFALNDRTCSGAVTANIRDTPQLTITGAGTAPVQADALSADTDIVTVTIGGNDLGFSDVAAFCVAYSADGPILNGLYTNCKDFYAPLPEVDQLAYKLQTVVSPALEETFALIASRAPHAKVFVIGYPTIAPNASNVPPAGCFSSALGTGTPPFPENAFPYTATDTAYLHKIEAELDAAIRAAAEANGATYLSTLEATAAHGACAPPAQAFVNGITLVPHGQGTPTPDPDIDVKLGALHPNTSGVAFLATTVSAAIGAAISPDDASDPGSEPAAEPGSGTAPKELAATGAHWEQRFAMLAAAGLALLLGIAAIIGRLEIRSRRGTRG